MKAFLVLFKTEAKLAFRGGDMLFFGIFFPVAVMLLLGFISEPEAVRLSFGGVAAVGICASALMGLPLTLSGYRRAKILKRLRATPADPALLLGAVSAVQAFFAVLSGTAVFLTALLCFGVEISGGPVRFASTFAFALVSVFSLGYLVASLAPDAKTANLACTILYFPMLFLSGATVPYEILPRGLRLVADFFPLTQAIALLKGAVLGAPADSGAFFFLAVLAVVSYAVSIKTFRWE